MTKTLDFAYETPQEVKVGDDETTFTLVCKNEGRLVDLTTATSITVKIGNRSGYLRGQQISIDSLANLPTGQFKFSFDKDTLANFPTGNYFLEVWVTDTQGTSIYPSGNPLNFIVTTNIENSSGATITTITFDDFVKAMNKAASTIAKGDKGDDGLSAYQVAVINGYKGSQTDWLASLKGDTGTVNNAGLISAPAFQSLQTHVNNSAVGTNLLLGTSKTLSTVTNASNWNSNIPSYLPNVTTVNSDTSYTIRAWISPALHDMEFQVIWKDSSGTMQYGSGNTIPAGTSGYSAWTGTITAGSTIKYASVVFTALQSTASSVSYGEAKLEKGSVATDWCPNPSEILTQSDYAKIKAAIVALGGALS
ncbi:collagen-like protein [Lactiplantibacillus plantarum]|uniref:collagen-like protein n=1 Tax=Lactiplantibacillus plantarum TaxID=1590 RepID=UPI003B6835D9